jgi:hypothetical protein
MLIPIAGTHQVAILLQSAGATTIAACQRACGKAPKQSSRASKRSDQDEQIFGHYTMFVRFRLKGRRLYVTLLTNGRINGKVRQEHIAPLGSIAAAVLNPTHDDIP